MLAVLICTVAVVPVAAVARVVGGDHLVPALIATTVAVLLWAVGLWLFRGPLMLDAFLAGRRRKRGPAPGGDSGGGGGGRPAVRTPGGGPRTGRRTRRAAPGRPDRCWRHRRPARAAGRGRRDQAAAGTAPSSAGRRRSLA